MVGDTHDGGSTKRRGSDRSSANSSEEAPTEYKKETMEFTPLTTGKHQSVTCDTVKECILQDTQTDLKNGLDMAVNLWKNEDTGMPTSEPSGLQAKGIKTESLETNVNDLRLEQESHDMEFTTDSKE